MLSPLSTGYRPLQEEDIPQVYQWHQAPHIIQWWDPPATYESFYHRCLQQITDAKPSQGFILTYAQQPIGYLQMYTLVSWPEYQTSIEVNEHAAVLDMFIGDVSYLYHGLGSALLRQFLNESVFGHHAFESCFMGPDPANQAAIKAYTKVGFQHFKTAHISFLDESQYLMRATPFHLGLNVEGR